VQRARQAHVGVVSFSKKGEIKPYPAAVIELTVEGIMGSAGLL
jgi:hypothetical protein